MSYNKDKSKQLKIQNPKYFKILLISYLFNFKFIFIFLSIACDLNILLLILILHLQIIDQYDLNLCLLQTTAHFSLVVYFVIFKLISCVWRLSEARGLSHRRSLHDVMGLVKWFLSWMLRCAILNSFWSWCLSCNVVLLWLLLLWFAGACFCFALAGLCFGCFCCRYRFAV